MSNYELLDSFVDKGDYPYEYMDNIGRSEENKFTR